MSLSRRYHVFIATAVITHGEHLPFPRGDVESTVLARRANSSVAECRTKSPVDLRTVKPPHVSSRPKRLNACPFNGIIDDIVLIPRPQCILIMITANQTRISAHCWPSTLPRKKWAGETGRIPGLNTDEGSGQW